MSSWAAWIPALWVVQFAVETTVEWLNLRALDPRVPAAFRDLYAADAYARAQRYARARARFGIAANAASLTALLVVWAGDGFGALDRWSRALGCSEIPTGLLFFAVLGAAQTMMMLPFRYYGTFVLEARYGFNRATLGTFVRDLATGLGLAVALGGPLLAAVLWLLRTAGDAGWLWCWLLGAGWIVALQYLAPTWLLPLFHRFTPLPEGELRHAILTYAARVGFPVTGIAVIDGSRRSTKANAFFTGFGARKRIALFDTLITSLAPDEIVAVVAHEIGHYRKRHVLIGLALALAHLGALAWGASLVMGSPAVTAAFGFGTHSVHASLVAFALLLGPIDLPLAVAMNALSRRHEYAADRFAADTLGTGEALAGGLRRLSVDTLANLTPHPAWVALHASHPPVLARVRALGVG